MHQPLTERSMHTQAGATIGTLEYMSPECCAGSYGEDIDTRSDVYAWRVLAELIAGSTPLTVQVRNSSELDLLRRIREKTRSRRASGRPDARLSAARRDLDCRSEGVEKDRARRYETASALARDLRAIRDGEPVEAACSSSTVCASLPGGIGAKC